MIIFDYEKASEIIDTILIKNNHYHCKIWKNKNFEMENVLCIEFCSSFYRYVHYAEKYFMWQHFTQSFLFNNKL